MDEISRGSLPQYAYHTTWDGCTVDIDPGSDQPQEIHYWPLMFPFTQGGGARCPATILPFS